MRPKIYKVELRIRPDGGDYYDSFVVVAKDSDEARSFYPEGQRVADLRFSPSCRWTADENNMKVAELGIAADGVEAQVVLASYVAEQSA